MILYVHTHAAFTDDTELDLTTPRCADVVLQHPDGPVGFDRGSGSDVIKAMIHDVVVIERANSPAWIQLEMESLSSRALHSQFKRVVTCSGPLPTLLQQLETVSSNQQQTRKNDLRVRHGKPPSPLAPTVFDDWIGSNGLPTQQSVRWLIGSCRTVVLWSFSEWGLYASILAHSVDEALEPVLRAGEELNMAIKQVHSESELPTW